MKTTRIRWKRILGMSLLLPLTGCEGVLGTGETLGAGEGTQGDGEAVQAPEGVEDLYTGTGSQWGIPALSMEPVSSPMVRLLQREYRQTVATAFDSDAAQMTSLPNDASDGVFLINAYDGLGDYGGYVDAASSVAGALASELLPSCEWAAEAEACFASELTPPIQALLRTSLSETERAQIASVMTESLAAGAPAEVALEGALLRVLLDERFLFRLELGEGGEVAPDGASLTGHEFANRLSYWLLDGPPNANLSAAAAGSVADPGALEAEIDALLQDESFREVIWQFVSGWLGIGAEAAGPDGLEASMHEETKRFVEHVLLDQRAPLSELFTAEYSFLDETMAEHYGVPAPAGEFDLVTLPPSSSRRGILTHASFLSANGAEERDVSWIFRGKIVYERLFCGHLPAPPPGVADVEVESREDPGSGCAGCHTIVDPTGRIFDMFDGHGAFIDGAAGDSGVRFGTDIDADFVDPLALAEKIPESLAFHHCAARMWFRFGLGREPHVVDGASLAAIEQVLRDDGSVFDLAKALLLSPAFSQLYSHSSEAVCQ